MVYHTILLLCFAFAFFSERYTMSLVKNSIDIITEQRQNLEKKLFFIIALYMLCLCGLRSYKPGAYVGLDTSAYYNMYLRYSSLNFSDIFDERMNDKGYVLFGWLLSKIEMDFSVLLFISAIIYVGGITWCIYRYSQNRWMSFFIFVAMGLYTFSFSAVRQSIAMGLCMIAYILSDKTQGWRGFILFIGITYIASTIHASAIIFLPVYLVQKISYKPATVFVFLGVAVATMLFKNQFASLLLQLAAETSEKYENYEMVRNAGAGIMLYLFVMMTVILCLLATNSKIKNDKKDNFVYLILCMLILFPATQSGGGMMRIYYYYYMFIVVFLPNVLESIEDLKTKQLAYLLLSMFLLWFYMSGDKRGLALIPYQFFWQ